MDHVRTGWQILATAFLSLGRNWSVVLRAAFVPLILPLAALAGFSWWAFNSGYALRYLPRHVGGDAQVPVLPLFLAALAAFGTLPVAVAWHRFDLLGERPRAFFPRVGFARSLGYLGRSLLIAVVTFLTALVLLLPLVLLASTRDQGLTIEFGALPRPLTAFNFLASTGLLAVVAGLVLRWSLILPGGAVGRNLTLREARQAAAARFGFPVFLLLGLFLHLAPICLNYLTSELATGVGAILILPFVLLFWFMFGIALLTTLYAHCVEGRPLA
jgi:hypothetical protein